ncbi:winged helix DNA-binding protein [Gluconacetobacter azotocaptans]|uniref:Winged helix DNA-binding protein n=1 Tax=Gluconacetobacter azotocaptans TaxID=142834 RepID=A0A7W4JSS1_9PROT|nr:MarR family transcriptional regulator [Gluconacetobacter azotocaptans]MBB2190219.1 winged helix DNA-binding protein [Gluconacetobacter azotocaptans]GBQ35943.1 MarR family transcriptional regulator [Gluconacetobacter azotocaptans DSM 13594]
MRAIVSPEISRLRAQLTRLARRLRQEARNDPESWTRMLVISAIDRLGNAATPSAIARMEDMRSSQVAAVLRDLETSGLVARHPDGIDRRVTRLVLTATGDAILMESRHRRDAWLADAIARQLTYEESKLLIQAGQLLERLAAPGADDPDRQADLKA